MGSHHALRDMWCKLARAGEWHAVSEQRVLLDTSGTEPVYKAADAALKLLGLDARSYAVDVQCVLHTRQTPPIYGNRIADLPPRWIQGLRTLEVNYSAAQAMEEMFFKLRAVHAVYNYRVLRVAVPADVPDDGPDPAAVS
eukprot:3590403-Amphidinium_carterae.2